MSVLHGIAPGDLITVLEKSARTQGAPEFKRTFGVVAELVPCGAETFVLFRGVHAFCWTGHYINRGRQVPASLCCAEISEVSKVFAL